ncbi:acetolactate synthase I/II/III large subunit [Rhizocola hellebori]|uniref:Acetolactate synthase I/II/III large subunit n=1 Tax=Rhizocola hellebori TaxID=1392758 RepID=A0A8J3QGL1_9ACTN|nr:acetolactate synthase large subunit [Rhizocola hellebori]GIH09692.1 acetolactate synthase I/II/III large subunit [Rhizocola hellebori]
MNGAQAILRTLVAGGVEVCFTNPGTSEMHLVAEMDSVPAMRGVLCLFEGVATGAADGYARMAQRPASTLLHLGPGLGNGLANLHNARRAGTPMVNIIGDHATYHERFDAPLQSDIAAMAGTVSKWVGRALTAAQAGALTAEAVGCSLGPAAGDPAGSRIATLILPADVCWSPGASPGAVTPASPASADPDRAEAVAKLLGTQQNCLLLLGGDALLAPGLTAASRVAQATGARLLAEHAPARHERGAGIPHLDRLAYLGQAAAAQLAGTQHLILAGARAPVTFFAYPDSPSDLVPAGCTVHDLGNAATLAQLAELVAPRAKPVAAVDNQAGLPSGELTAQTAAAVLAALLPRHAIVVDEAITSGRFLAAATAGSPRHDWLSLTGGAIGQGMPVATGAAIACPDRPVLNLQADGSAMYTLQALWTQAREGLNVTTVIFHNASYAILGMELRRVGAAGGERSRALLDLPGLDFVHLARGMGVPATRAATADDLAAQLAGVLAEPGPHLIEAMVP